MKFLCLLSFGFAAITAFGQQPPASIDVQSSGACSPNIMSNQGRVQFTCNAAVDKTTAATIVSLLNQLLRKEAGSDDLTADTNKKLQGILAFLKSPPPIKRTEKFAVMVPFDTEPNSFPIPTDENPDDPMHKTYWDLAGLATNGTVPSSAREQKGNDQITWRSDPVSMADAPPFLGRLLQYYILESIDRLERNSLTVYVGYPAEAQAGIEPPDATPYSKEKLFGELAGNRFFKPFKYRKSSDEMSWELKPIVLPRGTEIKFTEEVESQPRYLVQLERPGYFKIEYVVENFVGTGPGSVPKHFLTPHASTTMQWAFFVTMHYEMQRRADDNFHPELYAQWADALYAGLQQRLDEAKQPK